MFSRNIATLIKGTELANKIKLEVRNELINIRQTKPEFEPQFVAIAIGKFDYFNTRMTTSITDGQTNEHTFNTLFRGVYSAKLTLLKRV